MAMRNRATMRPRGKREEVMGRRSQRRAARTSARGAILRSTSGRRELVLRYEARRARAGYGRRVRRIRAFARTHWMDVVIVLAALEAALEVAVRHDVVDEPRTTAWLAAPAVAALILALLARRRH